MKTTQYNIAAGVTLSVPCTIPSRRVELAEDQGVPTQGLVIQLPVDNFLARVTVAEDKQPYIIGNRIATGGAKGPLLGLPLQVFRAADIYAKVSTLSGAATVLNVTEIE